MFKLRILIPALLLFAAIPTVSEAQLSIPFGTTTYSVEVQYEHWRSGTRYWSTVFDTENLEDAQLMYNLLFEAHQDGKICDFLPCSFDFIIVDVRLTWKTKYALIKPTQFSELEYQRYLWQIQTTEKR